MRRHCGEPCRMRTGQMHTNSELYLQEVRVLSRKGLYIAVPDIWRIGTLIWMPVTARGAVLVRLGHDAGWWLSAGNKETARVPRITEHRS
jgi:hypothetical protein